MRSRDGIRTIGFGPEKGYGQRQTSLVRHVAYTPPLTISRKSILTRGSDEQFRRMIYAFTQAASRLSAFRDVFGKDLEITPSQFAVLMSVAQCQGEEGVSIRDIADNVAMASTHVTTEVGRLKLRGLVKKKPSPVDGRSVLVTLSPKGQSEIDRVTRFVRDINDILFRDLDVETMNAVLGFSRSVIVNSELAMAEVRKRKIESRTTVRRDSA
jgi:DNA-binding MarR family transcriptional regulator